MDETDELLVDSRAGWVLLTLNRPARRNALTTALLGRLADALVAAAADPAVRAVVVTGAGGSFAAGADIGEMADKTAAESAADPRKGHWARIAAFPKPLIAAVDGPALGGGFELVLNADIVVLGATARLGLPETSLGLIPGAGGTQRLTALVGRSRAARMILLGEIVDQATAGAWGIASILAAGDALPEAAALADRLAGRAPLALRDAKAAVRAAAEAGLAEGFRLERALFEALHDSADKAEGVRAFLERRQPAFRGE
ncbi:MAG: enoyl-CoA hydratase-related protein [Rhodobacteraceae bacterium]|nr:enoyl-CoA hydratase-related protein [Paracoccaceae bacterium]